MDGIEKGALDTGSFKQVMGYTLLIVYLQIMEIFQ